MDITSNVNYFSLIYINHYVNGNKNKMNKLFDIPTLIVILTTFVLFTIALFTKGFTHDLLLEAGVFLVSVKLILLGYNNTMMNRKVLEELEEIKKRIKKDI